MTSGIGSEVAIVGVGESPYARRSTTDVKTLIMQAVNAALDDAGIAPDEVDGIVSEAAIVPSIMPHDEVAANLGLSDRVFSVQTGVGGAGTAAAPMLAAAALRSGLASTIVCYFGVDWGSSTGGPYGFHGADPYKASLEMPSGFYGQPVYFAAMAQRYMHEFGLTSDELGSVALSAREWAQMHPGAMMRRPLEMDQYYASPMIADPIHVLDCCLLTDGAAAFVMTSQERAKDCAARPVYASGFAYHSAPYSGHSYLSQNADYLATEAKVTAPRALAMAGVGVNDVDFAEIYDCFTITCLMQLEDMGFCEKGEAGAFVESGATRPGGSLPVNTHGGLLSHAYVLGINHIVEAVRQLRGECDDRQVLDAEVGVVSGYAGWEHTTLVLTGGK